MDSLEPSIAAQVAALRGYQDLHFRVRLCEPADEGHHWSMCKLTLCDRPIQSCPTSKLSFEELLDSRMSLLLSTTTPDH